MCWVCHKALLVNFYPSQNPGTNLPRRDVTPTGKCTLGFGMRVQYCCLKPWFQEKVNCSDHQTQIQWNKVNYPNCILLQRNLIYWQIQFVESDDQRHHSEHRINKILSEVNKPGDSQLPASLLLPQLPGLPGHGHTTPGTGHPQTPDELKLAALSFYQNELNQLHKLPTTDQYQSEEDSNQVCFLHLIRDSVISLNYYKLFRLSLRTVIKTQLKRKKKIRITKRTILKLVAQDHFPCSRPSLITVLV